MNLVRAEYDKPWIPYKCRVEFFLCSERTLFDAPVTTVHGFFFGSSKLLLVKHCRRGWEVPGGHIEDSETYTEGMQRELFEETQMKAGDLIQLGYLKKIAMEDKPVDCSYPHPLSYCIFYGGQINSVSEFKGDDSIIDAQFFDFDEAAKIPWIIAYKEYFDKAVELI